ncbi:uncharacterized protein [Physcomitrium patens]|uniref:Uncharacterized protein n=1 Tax=Physcomitrium patens TaxID=3218 RepID=A9RZA1_PHYPA|nr:uncharacterized protein LOC112290182 isoform X2 [Physcomitrium patens]PNR42908.1 hypothetical protein PHYPA_017740 [Physcomitrium patens]|eukprot:XP_024391977.1 uncharacterized protein LOC112290182 isoform X2 [Physcomitrella patens]
MSCVTFAGLPHNLSCTIAFNRTTAEAPRRVIHVEYGYYRSVTSCNFIFSVSPLLCSQTSHRYLHKQHTKYFSFQYGFSSLFNRNQGPEEALWQHGTRRSPRWMKKKIDRGIAPPTFAVDETSLDEVKVKIKVGPLSSLQERVYRFQKIFGSSSRLVVITLPKPLGIVFVESPLVDAYGKNRVMVGELVVGGNADRASRVAQLFDGRKNVASNTPILNGGVMPGDILRATTTVGVTVDFFGIRRPQRVMDLFVADGRPWHLITRALNASFVADGELTLVLERRNAYF